MDQWISCQLEALNLMVNHQFPIKMANDCAYTTMLDGFDGLYIQPICGKKMLDGY